MTENAVSKIENSHHNLYAQALEASASIVRANPQRVSSYQNKYSSLGDRVVLPKEKDASVIVYVPKIVEEDITNPDSWHNKPVNEKQENYNNLDVVIYLAHKIVNPMETAINKNTGHKFNPIVATIRCTSFIKNFSELRKNFDKLGIPLGYPENFKDGHCAVCDKGYQLNDTLWGTPDNPGVILSDPRVKPYLEQWRAEYISEHLSGVEPDMSAPKQKRALMTYIRKSIDRQNKGLIKGLRNQYAGSIRPIVSEKTQKGLWNGRFVVPAFKIKTKKERHTVLRNGRNRTVFTESVVYKEDGTPDVELVFIDQPGEHFEENFIKRYADEVAKDSDSDSDDTEQNIIGDDAYNLALDNGLSETEAEQEAIEAFEYKKTLPDSFIRISFASTAGSVPDPMKGYKADRHPFDKVSAEDTGYYSQEVTDLRDYLNNLAEEMDLTRLNIEKEVKVLEWQTYPKIQSTIAPIFNYWVKEHQRVINENENNSDSGVVPQSKGATFSSRRNKPAVSANGSSEQLGIEASPAPSEQVVDAEVLDEEPEVQPEPVRRRAASRSPRRGGNRTGGTTRQVAADAPASEPVDPIEDTSNKAPIYTEGNTPF